MDPREFKPNATARRKRNGERYKVMLTPESHVLYYMAGFCVYEEGVFDWDEYRDITFTAGKKIGEDTWEAVPAVHVQENSAPLQPHTNTAKGAES